jgi:hypothetical protein
MRDKSYWKAIFREGIAAVPFALLAGAVYFVVVGETSPWIIVLGFICGLVTLFARAAFFINTRRGRTGHW